MTKKEKEAHLKNPRPKKRASLKQYYWVNEFIRNKGNGTEAALAVYDTKSRKAAGVIARDNLKKPVIKELITETLEKNGISTQKSIEWLKAGVEHNLTFGKPSQAVAATLINTVLKLQNAFPAKTSIALSYSKKESVGSKKLDEIANELKKLNLKTSTLMQGS